MALQRLDEVAEKAKLELSTATETEINIPFITTTDAGPQHLLLKITRAKLEELADEFIAKAIKITKEVVADSPFEISDINEIIMVGGQTRMPKIIEEVKNLFNGKQPNQSINPDEVVALGAAIQAGVLQGDVKDILLLDVTPLSLGIETMGGVASKLIEKNTTIPATKTQVFSTAVDNQTSTEINVVQGERPMATDNKSLGKFVLDGIPPAPRGVPQVEVTFDIDANGILKVSAKDKTSGKENSIKIEGSSGLSDEEIEKMKADAEAHADEDAKKKEIVDTKNMLDSTIFMAEKALKDDGDKISDDLKKSLQEKIDEAKKVKEGEDLDAIKKVSEELSTEAQKISAEMQKASEENKEGKTSDAEVVNEDDKKEEDGEDSEKKDEKSEDKKD